MSLKACPYCAESVQAAATKCKFCGEDLVRRSPESEGAAETDADPKEFFEIGNMMGWVTRDPEWVNRVMIGAVLTLFGSLLIPTFILMGYKIRIMRQQRRKPGTARMPTFDDMGALLGDGFKLFVVIFLPMMLMVGMLTVGLTAFGLLLAGSQGKGPGAVIGGIGMLVTYGLFFIAMFAFMYFMPAMEMEYVETGSVTSGIRLGALWRRVAGGGFDYLILFLFHYLVMQIVAPMLGMVLACIGILFTYPWGLYVDGCMIGRYMAKQDIERANSV